MIEYLQITYTVGGIFGAMALFASGIQWLDGRSRGSQRMKDEGTRVAGIAFGLMLVAPLILPGFVLALIGWGTFSLVKELRHG